MAYLAQLLNDGIFDEIYVSFLPVGHTHEDIDQVSAVQEIQIQKYMIYIYPLPPINIQLANIIKMFSRLGEALRYNDTVTLEEMMEVFKSAYKTASGHYPAVSVANSIANVSDYVDAKTKHWPEFGLVCL